MFDATVNGQRYALKVVAKDAENPQSVAEYWRMVAMHSSHPDLVAKVVEGSLVNTDKFIYYFLSDVGHGGNHRIGARAAILKLAEFHSLQTTHGDPRIQNIIELENGSLKWIDLRLVKDGDRLLLSVSHDIRVLFESIFHDGIFNDNDISQSAQEYINGVREKKSGEELQTLLGNVYDLCKK